MESKKTIVIKYGGNAMKDPKIKEAILDDIASIHKAGHKVILVHGGGPFINKILESQNIQSEFIAGQRKTTDEAIKYIEMALTGEVNPDLVRSLRARGINAVGLSGKDGQLIETSKMYLDLDGAKTDIGWVGKIEKVNPAILETLMDGGFFTVLTCMSSDDEGQAYNINGDVFAGEIAAAVAANYYIVMTDVDGLLMDKDKPETLISHLSLTDITPLKGKVIAGGMIPKIESCESSIKKGTKEVRIINGTKPGTLKQVVLEGKEIGTSITE